MGVITASLILKEHQATSVDTSLVAFIDGSYKSVFGKQIPKGVNSGVGGLIKLQNGKKILEFSGPSPSLSALEPEKHAFSTLLQILKSHSWNHSSITIFSDSQLLIKDSSHLLSGFCSLELSNVCIKFISRIYNKEVDLLAKRGAHLKELLISWS